MKKKIVIAALGKVEIYDSELIALLKMFYEFDHDFLGTKQTQEIKNFLDKASEELAYGNAAFVYTNLEDENEE